MSGLMDAITGTTTTATKGFGPIDIKAPAFFRLVQPWKEGTLATIDGWGRYAEISFVGADKMRIKPLVNFPRASQDGLMTWPEAGLIAGKTGKMHHLAAVDDGKTKSHIPLLSWVHLERDPVLFDPREGLVCYCYVLDRYDTDVNKSLFIYNYKKDKMVYESRDELPYTPLLAMNERYALSNHTILNGKKKIFNKIFYGWRANEAVENDLTKELQRHQSLLIIRPCHDIHLGRRYLFTTSEILGQYSEDIKITWDENYSDVKVTPLSYLKPEGKSLGHFVLSLDGSWASAFVTGFKGLYNEDLCKRAFFHLDERYPNGISMPVVTDDYEDFGWDYSAFVNHPVHGMCFAQEWHKEKKLYLRLYKMSDILAEINRQLLEKVKGVVK
jgi:hypothetical protein